MRWLLLATAALLAGCQAPSSTQALDVTGYLVAVDGQMQHQYHSGSHVVTCSGEKGVHMVVLTVADNQWPARDGWRVHSHGAVSPAMELEYWSSGDGGSLYVYGCLDPGTRVDELTYEVDGRVVARAHVDQVPSTMAA